MSLYEIGISFDTSDNHKAYRVYNELIEVLKKYPRLFPELPELESYDDGENDEEEYYDDDEGL